MAKWLRPCRFQSEGDYHASHFVSYRRDDTTAILGRIGERLRKQFGKNNVAIDQGIPPGAEFREHIYKSIEWCDVALVLIGERWVCGATPQINRLENVEDFVRIEVEMALSRKIQVIPVLVGKGKLPAEDLLPESLQGLLSRQAIVLDDAMDFDYHIQRLITSLQGVKSSPRPPAVLTAPDEHPSQAKPDGPQERTAEAATVGVPPRVSGSLRFAPIRLTGLQGVGVTAFLLLLNSILAALGSILWGEIYYWPAFMVSALACAQFGYWGLVVAVLSPVVSCLLMIGGAPFYPYVIVNVLQGSLVLGAFRAFRIDPGLGRLRDKLMFLVAGAALPSACGAVLAWWLRRWWVMARGTNRCSATPASGCWRT